MNDLLEKSFTIHSDASTTQVGGETVILHLTSGIYFGLDGIGTKIWECIANGQSVSEICGAIAKEYGEPREHVEHDTLNFLKDLIEADLISISSSQA